MDDASGPYDSPRFGGETHLEPNPGPAKTLGILNVVFACGLLLCGTCYGFYTVLFSAMSPMIAAQQQAAEAEHQARLREQQQAAPTDEERAAIQAQIDAADQRKSPDISDVAKIWGLQEPIVIGFYMTDVASGLILNVVMLIVGGGLLGLREWGRKGGVFLSAFKLLRLVVLYGFAIAVVAPQQASLMVEGAAEFARQMPPRAGQPPPGAETAAVYGMLIAGALAVMVLGAIYPAISLWLLTRPGVKAAMR